MPRVDHDPIIQCEYLLLDPGKQQRLIPMGEICAPIPCPHQHIPPEQLPMRTRIETNAVRRMPWHMENFELQSRHLDRSSVRQKLVHLEFLDRK